MMTTPTAPSKVVREKKFKIKISACVKEETSQRILIDTTEHEYVVTPPEYAHRTPAGLQSKCELMAREQYSNELWDRMSKDSSLDIKLADREWYIFTKTKKLLPLF